MFLGIDGGGTKTTFLVCDVNLNPVFEIEKGPTAIRSLPFEEVINTLVEGIFEAHHHYPQIQSIYMGLGDISGPRDENYVLDALRPRLKPWHPIIQASNDVYIAHAGGLEGAHGMVLISGTGSVALGIDETKILRTGGVSFQEGDEGSGYYLGKMVLKSLVKAADGRINHSRMTRHLQSTLNLGTLYDYAKLFETLHNDRSTTAQYAKYATEYALHNDEVAIQLIDQTIDHLVQLIKPIHQILHVQQKQLALVGSLAQEKTVFRPKLVKAIHQLDSEILVFDAKKSPTMGACILAKKNLKAD